MKRILTILTLTLFTLGAMAVPAKKGIWQTMSLNGTLVKARLVGDEHMHYWLTDDGRQLTEVDGTFTEADMPRLTSHAQQRRTKAAASRQRRVQHRAVGDFSHYSGQKKGLIILVEYNDLQLQADHDSVLYSRICNETGYSEGQFQGSVHDYFLSQSYGEFDLTFDVVGPIRMPKDYKYYGENDADGNDLRPGELVVTACQAVDSYVDFSRYDWDGDGTVDQVVCIYAGQGENAYGGASTIWPHEWTLSESDYQQPLTLDGVSIDTYAVTSELMGSSIDGIGTLCHEFSHCLGLPDFYDVMYKGNFGMGEWSLMSGGSYNNNGFCPVGYTSFERYTCGWLQPRELTEDQVIEGMQPLSDVPEAYLMRNAGYANEYFLIENRQQKDWDASAPGAGLLITYVDYDYDIWANNQVNTLNEFDKTYGVPIHQHCTIVHAGNRTTGSGSSSDVYPYNGNDSLTNTSVPAAKLWHNNADGSLLLNKGILNIKRHNDGTMSFRFRNSASDIMLPEETIFYESFNNCTGTGGNDGTWNTTMASSTLHPDNIGWGITKGYGGFACARFGNAITPGRAVTPVIDMPTGEALLTFRAAGWNTDGDVLALSVEGNGTVSPSELTMKSFEWTDYSVRVSSQRPLRIIFQPDKRFLLDEVLVLQLPATEPSAVSTIQGGSHQQGYYTLDGRFAGNSLQSLPHGIYLQRSTTAGHGRKVAK